MSRLSACLAAATLVVLLAAAPAQACRLALVLALDVSSSVDVEEHALQIEGLASALEDPEVMEAILLPGGPVAIAVFEWSGRDRQSLVADWAMLRSPTDIFALTARIRGSQRSHAEYPTALGHAMAYAGRLFARGPDCENRTVDVSGDGANNDGYEPFHAYRVFDFEDITVNALVVGGPRRPALIRYFQTLVIRGDAAFTEVADGYADFERAMRRKLLREIRPPMVVGALE